MKTIIKILAFMLAAIVLLFGIASNLQAQGEHEEEQSSDDCICILNYSCKPVGYVSENRFIESKWNIELKNNEEITHRCTIKILFYDKDEHMLMEDKRDVKIKASQTKKYTGNVLLEPTMAKQVSSTKAFIEDIH